MQRKIMKQHIQKEFLTRSLALEKAGLTNLLGLAQTYQPSLLPLVSNLAAQQQDREQEELGAIFEFWLYSQGEPKNYNYFYRIHLND